jgi:hypothetical protein
VPHRHCFGDTEVVDTASPKEKIDQSRKLSGIPRQTNLQSKSRCLSTDFFSPVTGKYMDRVWDVVGSLVCSVAKMLYSTLVVTKISL